MAARGDDDNGPVLRIEHATDEEQGAVSGLSGTYRMRARDPAVWFFDMQEYNPGTGPYPTEPRPYHMLNTYARAQDDPIGERLPVILYRETEAMETALQQLPEPHEVVRVDDDLVRNPYGGSPYYEVEYLVRPLLGGRAMGVAVPDVEVNPRDVAAVGGPRMTTPVERDPFHHLRPRELPPGVVLPDRIGEDEVPDIDDAAAGFDVDMFM